MRITTDPTRELAMLQRDVATMFDQFTGSRAGYGTRWVPPLDIVELDDHYTLTMDLPGMADRDLTIELEDRVLRIAGERRDEREHGTDGMRRIERSFGSFERTLTLPRGVDGDGVDANLDNGVLEVTVPKPAASRPRRIDVTSSQQQVDGTTADVEGRELAHA